MSEKKSKAGRKSKYNEEIQKIADEYVDNFSLYMEVNGKKIPNSIPSIADLAFKLRVHRDTVYEWCKHHCQFSDTLERLNQVQERFLVHHGLVKNYDSGFAKFLAVNMTKYKDKVESTVDQKTVQINVDKEDTKL